MKIELHPTTATVLFRGVECRVWQGTTDRGVAIDALIARVASTSKDPREHEVIASELRAVQTPAVDWPMMLALYEPAIGGDYEDVDDAAELDDADD